ncbi:hypothetical protein FUMI01_16560 [Flavobacterium sp. UMI-01]|nr:hypothetical protein FUMI01_16560 [Flavobacterium sp. UMI-01]
MLLFISCNKDEIPTAEQQTFDPNLLLRGWSYDTIVWNEQVYEYDHNPDCYKDFFGFRNNETQPYQFEQTYFTSTYCSGRHLNLRWEPIGNHIDFYFGTAKVDKFEVISLTETHFIYAIDRDIDDDGKKEHLTVTAIPYDPYNSFEIKTQKTKKLQLFPKKLPFTTAPH